MKHYYISGYSKKFTDEKGRNYFRAMYDVMVSQEGEMFSKVISTCFNVRIASLILSMITQNKKAQEVTPEP